MAPEVPRRKNLPVSATTPGGGRDEDVQAVLHPPERRRPGEYGPGLLRDGYAELPREPAHLAFEVGEQVVVVHQRRTVQPRREEELAAIPEPLREDWAAQQICLSYDLSVVGSRWVDLFLSAGLSPHRVHHVLPWQGSGFANLASEVTVREVCAQAGIAWERPRNLIFERFPAVIKHYLLVPAKPAPPPPPAFFPGPLPPPPPPDALPARSPSSVRHQVGTLFRYSVDGGRGVGV